MDGIIDSTGMNLSKLWEMVKDTGARHAVVHGFAKTRTQLSNWTTPKMKQSSEASENLLLRL